MLAELVLVTVALSAGSANNSLLHDNVYGEVGPDDEYDHYEEDVYGGYDDTDYTVTVPGESDETTDKTTTSVTTTVTVTVTATSGSGGNTDKRPASRGPIHYVNGTLYEDYDCSKYKFSGLSGAAPKGGGGSGPALAVICVCLAVTAVCDALRKHSD